MRTRAVSRGARHCGRELTVPKPAPLLDAEFASWEPRPSVTSGRAIASLVLGALLFFACLSGLPAIVFGCRRWARSSGAGAGSGARGWRSPGSSSGSSVAC